MQIGYMYKQQATGIKTPIQVLVKRKLQGERHKNTIIRCNNNKKQ